MAKFYFLLLASMFAYGCNFDVVTPSGPIKKVEVPFSNFNSIEVNNGFELILTFANYEKVEIEANENIHQYVEFYQSGNKIKFEREDNINFDSRTKVKIYVTAKNINNLEGSGGANITTTNLFDADKLKLSLSGGSIFNSSIRANYLEADVSGGGIINLDGNLNTYNLESSGGSVSNGFNLTANHLIADISGGGVINITVKDKLDINATGGSVIQYKGTGQINSQSLSGGSLIIRK